MPKADAPAVAVPTTARRPDPKPYERFKAWVACHQLVLAVYRETAGWPKSEMYCLTAQARRAAFSAAVNIAEGSAKRGAREFRRYLDISLGSLSELACILLIARDVEVMASAAYGEVEAHRDHANRLTWGLYRALGCRTRADNAAGQWPNSKVVVGLSLASRSSPRVQGPTPTATSQDPLLPQG